VVFRSTPAVHTDLASIVCHRSTISRRRQFLTVREASRLRGLEEQDDACEVRWTAGVDRTTNGARPFSQLRVGIVMTATSLTWGCWRTKAFDRLGR